MPEVKTESQENELLRIKESKLEQIRMKLNGKTLALNPSTAGMYVDEQNGFQLDFFADSRDKIIYKKDMDPIGILRNIKANILKVYDDGKDISEIFGGKKSKNLDRTPIVENVPRRADKKVDMPLLQLLGRPKEQEVLRDIESLNDFNTLQRLEELEKQGKNLSAVGRPNVINLIRKKMKKLSGVSDAKKLSQDKDEIVEVK